MRFIFAAIVLCLSAGFSAAQDSETLADIRQELTVLNVEMQKLKRELSTTGASGNATLGASVLQRVDGIEAELRRLTARTEELGLRVEAVVQDGTRRVADLEFRLVELEGGDVSKLGETSTLGGDLPGGQAAAPVVSQPIEGSEPMPELAVGEQADFAAARKALEAGEYADAAERLRAFNETYPGSPVASKAALAYGAALEGQGDLTGAARAYLDAFRRDPNGEDAPESLFRLGQGLGRLGQTVEACKTLAEVGLRFPGGEPASKADAERTRLGCS
ncbi:tol-pal system protein YbgF [Lentibacter sp. XHP0401]|jgi:tol-pal system protein YbgF|uniref:tol-pal system protein YbgF n=1 Tax=Lentibacter sp. XHP0401 TaxID=2984334 RepID=UPI0021E89C6D|nr:tol-pal system protein YbgF [Lentibacter sp. XHP0401]MCV2894140.1 tol-pal system protein YbgF [Lentibacter sp. XHP0401]